MKRKLIHIVLFLAVSFNAAAQDDYVLDKDSLQTKDKLHYSFSVGAGVGYSSNLGDYFSTYYSPSISYDVSPEFSIAAGLTHVRSSVDALPMRTDFGYQNFTGNIAQYYSYVEGNYKVNDKLIVGGSIFYDFSNYQDVNGSTYQPQNNLDNIGYSAHARYKVSKNMTIEAELRVNDKSPMRGGFFGGAEHNFIGR